MSKKLISVLTPTYNRAEFLAEAIFSVQNQKEDGFTHEHIIIDNASSDNTDKVVKELAKKDKRIKYIRNNENILSSGALNVGFKASKGEFIIQFDDDDLLPASSLQFRYNFFQKTPKASWAYGYMIYITSEKKLGKHLSEHIISYKEEKNLVSSLLGRNFIPGGTPTIRREAIKKVGGWTEGIKTQDFDMSLKLAANNYKPYKMDSYLYYYRLHPAQVTNLHREDGTIIQERAYYLKKYKKFLNKAQLAELKGLTV